MTVLQILTFDGVMLNQRAGLGHVEIDYTSCLARAIVFVLGTRTRAMTAGPQWLQIQI